MKKFKIIIFIIALTPFVNHLYQVVWGDLGANPIEAIILSNGEWSMRFLLLTLSLSSMRRVFSWPKLMSLRRMLGLYTYFYAMLHFTMYFVFEQTYSPLNVWLDIVQRPFIAIGMATLLALTPLALTSNKAMMKRMGRQWKRLHQWVYIITPLVMLHYIMMIKLDKAESYPYIAWLLLLAAERLWNVMRKAK